MPVHPNTNRVKTRIVIIVHADFVEQRLVVVDAVGRIVFDNRLREHTLKNHPVATFPARMFFSVQINKTLCGAFWLNRHVIEGNERRVNNSFWLLDFRRAHCLFFFTIARTKFIDFRFCLKIVQIPFLLIYISVRHKIGKNRI